MIIGRNVGLMYGKESAYGTAVAATTSIGKIKNFAPVKNNNFVQDLGLGDGRNTVNFLFGNFAASGSITFEPHDFTFLQFAVGAIAGDGGVGTPWTLTEANEYGVTASDMRSFTLIANKEDGSSDEEDTYTGVILTDVTMSGTETGVLTATANFVAKSVSDDTAIANAYTPVTIAPWTNIQAVVSWGASPTAVAKVVSWSVTINNNPIIYRSVGSRFIEEPVAGRRIYSFTLTVRDSQAVLTALTATMYDDASEPYTPNTSLASAEPTASLEFKVVFTGATNRSGTLQLDEAVLNDMSEPVNLGEEIVQSTFNGFAKEGKNNIPLTWVD